MNKRGFTLVELLAVLALLSLLTIITIPIINSRKTAINLKEYNALVEDIESAAKIHVSNNPQLLNNIGDGECISVLISDLQTAKLLENNLVDPRDNSEIEGTEYVNVCVDGENITYTYPYPPE